MRRGPFLVAWVGVKRRPLPTSPLAAIHRPHARARWVATVQFPPNERAQIGETAIRSFRGYWTVLRYGVCQRASEYNDTLRCDTVNTVYYSVWITLGIIKRALG